MSDEQRVYVVFYEHGEYEDHEEYIVKVFDSAERAKAFVDGMNAKIEKWAATTRERHWDRYWDTVEYQELLNELSDLCDEVSIIDLDRNFRHPFSCDLDGNIIHS